MYRAWCEKARKPIFPYDGRNLNAWIKYLGSPRVGICVGSITDVIIPSLKRLHDLHNTGQKVSQEVSDYLKQAVNELKRDGVMQREKNPCTINDVEKIIENYPEGKIDKSAEASLYLFAVSTGCRAISCSNIQVNDIMRIDPTRDGSILISIKVRRTKGTCNWNHTVSLEGELDFECSTDFVFWLDQYFRDRFGCRLMEFAQNRNLVPGDVFLWPWKEDALNERLKRAAKFAGYPHVHFSFHSLRSGFLCSALLKAGMNEESVNNVMDTTAFVAGWARRGKAQRRYVKEAYVRSIVSTRLVTGDSVQIIREDASNPVVFHNLNGPLKPNWDPTANYEKFHRRFMNYIASKRTDLDQTTLKKYQNRLLSWCHNTWVNNDPELIDELEEKICEWEALNPDKPVHIGNLKAQISRKDIINKLNDDVTKLESMLQTFVLPAVPVVEEKRILKNNVLKKKRKKIEYDNHIPRPTYDNLKVRKRVAWSESETASLKRLYPEYSSLKNKWIKLKAHFPNRTNTDIKDKWRVIEREKQKN
jgi:hypothetical protein